MLDKTVIAVTTIISVALVLCFLSMAACEVGVAERTGHGSFRVK